MTPGVPYVRNLSASQLQTALAIALRTKKKGEARTVVREYRRRGISIPNRLYHWLRDEWPDLATERFEFSDED